VEFGFKAQVTDNVDGVIVDHELHKGNPPDAPMLVPAISRIKARFGRAPTAVTADRGYGEAALLRWEQMGLQHRCKEHLATRQKPRGLLLSPT
jgi:IS5 family transposase